MFEGAGHRVMEAIDGLHAIALATRYLPDVTVTDLVLPELDGVELSVRMASNPDLLDIPIVLVRDPGSTLDTWDASHPIVASDQDLLQHVQQFVAARTSLVES